MMPSRQHWTAARATASAAVVVNARGADQAQLHPCDAWDAWLFAEAEASLALSAWFSAPSGAKASAHALYEAAAAREARAAGALAASLAESHAERV
jgi:hypothetical protein